MPPRLWAPIQNALLSWGRFILFYLVSVYLHVFALIPADILNTIPSLLDQKALAELSVTSFLLILRRGTMELP